MYQNKLLPQLFDFAIVGGGLVGLATARELLARYPSKTVIVLEKEHDVALHQSSHNSGVIHAGMYYVPGSMKAKLCVEGARLMYEFAQQHDVPHRRIGKLIVAVSEEELPSLHRIFQRGLQNGVPDLTMLTAAQLQEKEPAVRGLAAIWSPHTGIIDYKSVAKALATQYLSPFSDRPSAKTNIHDAIRETIHEAQQRRGFLKAGFPVARFEPTAAGDWRLHSDDATEEPVTARFVITAAGLQADQVAMRAGAPRAPQIVPFRGSFLKLRAAHRDMVKHLVYPVPNPAFPFLGVHVTPTPRGDVILGPNAVLASAREGYHYGQFDWDDMVDLARNPGLRRLAGRHFAHGLGELYRDIVPSAFVTAVQKYVPMLHVDQTETGPSGVRAIALSDEGTIIDDFVFQKSPGFLHVRNAPSPAATSCFAIARVIVDQLSEE